MQEQKTTTINSKKKNHEMIKKSIIRFFKIFGTNFAHGAAVALGGHMVNRTFKMMHERQLKNSKHKDNVIPITQKNSMMM